MHHRRALVAAGFTVILAAGATLVPLAAPAAAAPTTFVVTSGARTGPGTFDQAVLDANANPGRDTIVFDLGGFVPQGGVAAPFDRPVRITDAVVIDACADDDNPYTEPGVLLAPGAATTLLIDAPDVTVQGVSLPVAGRPVDVTAAGDRFVYRNGVVSVATQTFRVTGAEDVVIGGPGAAGCLTGSLDGGVIIHNGAGFELVDTVGARLESILGRYTFRETVLVTGGRGTQLFGLFLEGTVQEDTPLVRLDGAGTATDPVRFVGGYLNHCLGGCLLVANGSHLDLGAPGVSTQLLNTLGRPEVPVRIEGSSANIHDAVIRDGDLGGIVVGAGAFDTTIADNEIIDNHQAGIRLEGTPAPSDVRITGNFIGYRRGDDTNDPSPARNFELGIQVDAADGLQIEDNLISANYGGGIELHAAATNVRIVGNRIGSDPTTEQVPEVFGDPEPQPFGVVVRGGQGIVIEDNVVAANTVQGIGIVGGAAGVVVARNRVGTNAAGTVAAGNGGSGVGIGADDVVVRGNTIGGNAGVGVLVNPGADRARVTGNRIGGTGIPNLQGVVAFGDDVAIEGNDVGANNGLGIRVEDGRAPVIADNAIGGTTTAIVVGSGATVRNNGIGIRRDGTRDATTANAVGIDVGGNDNVLTGNLVTGTTATDRAVFVRGQRNTVTRAAMFGNAGHAIDLAPPPPAAANGGIAPPTMATAVFRGPSSMQVTGSAAGVITGTVDVYANHACGPLDHEAEVWLGRVPVANGAFIGTVSAPLFLGSQLTATATDGGGNTSEVSNCHVYTGSVGKPPRVPTPPPPPPFPPVFPTP